VLLNSSPSPIQLMKGNLMRKSDLITAVAADTGSTLADAGRAIDSTLASIERALVGGEEVALTGFGKFSVANRPARTGRNPQTGESIQIKASKAPKFTPGMTLKKKVNGGR
jgi:DNA-binding protein HU-beta